MDEALRAIEWAIATKPEIYPVVLGSDVHVAKTRTSPPLRIAFAYNDETAALLEIEPIPLEDIGLE